MTLRTAFLSGAAVVAAAAVVAGCSSSSSPTPAPSPMSTSAQVPVANAARGSSTLALDALKTVRYYAQFVRPGTSARTAIEEIATRKDRSGIQPDDPHAVPTPNPAPSCDSSTQTALSSTVDQSRKNYTVITAFYPQGDTKCSQSPYAVLEMYYPDVPRPFSQGPQEGVGYEATFTKGAITEFDVVTTEIYAAGKGSANFDSRIDRYDAEQSPALTPPPAGKFPASFPLALPLPNPPPVGAGQSFVSDYYATLEKSGGTSQTGTASLILTNADFLPYSTLGPQQNLAAVDSLNVAVGGPNNGGTFSYSAKHDDPLYAFDVVPITLTSGSNFLGPGKTAWALNPLTSGSFASNFGTAPSDRATFSVNGSVLSDDATFVDTVNAVTAALRIDASASQMTEADDLRHQPATNVPVVTLSSDGSSKRFQYRRDHSIGLVLVDSVAE